MALKTTLGLAWQLSVRLTWMTMFLKEDYVMTLLFLQQKHTLLV